MKEKYFVEIINPKPQFSERLRRNMVEVFMESFKDSTQILFVLPTDVFEGRKLRLNDKFILEIETNITEYEEKEYTKEERENWIKKFKKRIPRGNIKCQ